MKEKFNVSGMTCSACQAAVEKSVKKLDGIKSADVNLLSNSMLVEFDNNIITEQKIIKAVEDAGYRAYLTDNKTDNKNVKPESEENIFDEDFKHKIKELKWSIIFLIPLMYIAMGSMINLPQPYFFKGQRNILNLALTQMFLTIPVLIINSHYFKNGFKTLIKRNPNMDSLIAIGSGASFIYGIFVIYRLSAGFTNNDVEIINRYSHSLYFESSAMILTLITFGKSLEVRAKKKTTNAINSLIKLTPDRAEVIRDNKELTIYVKDINEGDIVIVKPGSNIPVDGIITEGATSVDESCITGESLPVEKKKGDKVLAATTNKSGFIKFRATRVGNDTTISKIIELVEEASSTKAPIAKLADRVSGIFVPVVLSVSLITFIYWIINADIELAINMAVSVLVISCPCALGLATPVAIMVATGKGAKMGILFKNAQSLENLHSAEVILLDKTGTITKGEPSVVEIETFGIDKDRFIQIAASLEKNSEHPLAKAIVKYAKEKEIELKPVNNFTVLTGSGVFGEIDNNVYITGSLKLMEDEEIDISSLKDISEKYSKNALTPVFFADEEKVIGTVGLKDTVKSSSQEAIRLFKESGKYVAMVTGDNKITAQSIANNLDLDEVFAEVMPEDKEKIVKRFQSQGKKTIFTGDGINDSPALVRSDIGVAIGAGTDIAIESADVVLIKSELLDLYNAIKLSEATLRNIKQNLFWAFFYNSIGIPIAAGMFYNTFGIQLNPMMGALAMSFSSVFVVTNALRLNRFHTYKEV